jgi:rhodanese-related sulfurtransferase
MKNIKISRFLNILVIFLIGITSTTIVYGETDTVFNDGYTDITPEQAWEMFNDTSNGIQYPIDVRTLDEWLFEHILTPPPENARHHCSCEWEENETILMEFIDTYEGEEIVLYCRSGVRSVAAANKLIDYGFVGTIYNMLGGIISWKDANLPTIGNQAPEKPIISGPSSGKPGEEIELSFTVNEPDNDQIFLYVNWSDGSNTVYTGPHDSGKEIKLKHTWEEEGNYNITAKAWDIYQKESEISVFPISMPKNHGIFENILNILIQKILLFFKYLIT